LHEKSPVSMGSTLDSDGTDKNGTDDVSRIKSGTNSGQEGVTFGTTTGSEEPKDVARTAPCGNETETKLPQAS